MCPSIVMSVIKLVSTLDRGFTVVKWLTWCDVVLVVVIVSGLKHLLTLLGHLVTSFSVFVLWQWCLQLLEVRGCCLLFL